MFRCQHCGKFVTVVSSFYCKVCEQCDYCSNECMRADQVIHSKTCKPIGNDDFSGCPFIDGRTNCAVLYRINNECFALMPGPLPGRISNKMIPIREGPARDVISKLCPEIFSTEAYYIVNWCHISSLWRYGLTIDQKKCLYDKTTKNCSESL